ncbi:MAG: SpoIVB peptidase [Clostridia bacterium]|nr:SpoIVB peptidase [Clostridia bacterium]
MKFKKALIAFSLIFSTAFSFSSAENSFFKNKNTSPCIAEITANETETSVIPGGNCIGVTLCTDGVLVVSTSEVTSEDGTHTSPAENAGIKPGDLIQSFNGTEISSVEDLNNAILDSGGKNSSVVFKRKNKNVETLLTPKKSYQDGTYRIGAWVKDAASGIGTMTFYNPKTKSFAALGHGICDSDTGNILTVDTGSILPSTIVSVDKGEKGVPGELNGVFEENSITIGRITTNCDSGIFGTIDNNFTPSGQLVSIEKRQNVKIGNAYILANIEGNRVEKFNIEIIKILPKSISSQKGMIIKVTDDKLLSKTGGIVQGMSGSPIIQNGRIVGAVTHVFVNDPTRGYGIFIENMLAEAEKIK